MRPCNDFRCGALLHSGTGCYGLCYGFPQLPGLGDDLQERRLVGLLVALLQAAGVQPPTRFCHVLHRQMLPFRRPLPAVRVEAQELTRRVPRQPVDMTALLLAALPLLVPQTTSTLGA